MRGLIQGSICACFLMALLAAMTPAEARAPVVNLMINADMPLSASDGQKQLAEEDLFRLYTAIKEKNLTATIFSTQDFVYSHARLRLTDIGLKSSFELAMSGNRSGERLSSLNLERQKEILQTSKQYVEGCRVCGVNQITVRGFMPQSFDQNENTYKALDELGMAYDAGFQAGLLYAPGHKEDVWPYKVPNHKFYAVPVSSHELSGKMLPLVDSYANETGLSSSQWLDLLRAKFDDAQGKDEPVVISLSTPVSGQGEYLGVLGQFLDYALSNGARFVTTMDLVNMTLPSGADLFQPGRKVQEGEESGISNLSMVQEGTERCEACEKERNASINVTAVLPGVMRNATVWA